MPINVDHLWNQELILKHDLSGPRYTSYPTAPQFREGFTHEQWLAAVNNGNTQQTPLSLYFHIPFCNTVCYYCACNKIITANKKLAEPYVVALDTEIQLQAKYIDKNRTVEQLHWGGGTPSYLSDAQMTQLMQSTAEHFQLLGDDSGEYSIEIHPLGVTPDRLGHIRSLGFNRLSMGVQDFNEQVQQSVNRYNSVEEVSTLVDTARRLNFHSISIDLIYGLPLQNRHSFAETVKQIIQLRPDRLSVFNYAHLPELFKTQKQINAELLPEPQEKLHMLHETIEALLQAGYVYVGMDHFALPDDELAVAQAKGELHRNFQGYTTHGNCDLHAFGISSIAAFGDNFVQNYKDIESYYAAINQGRLPLYKGFQLSSDDKIRQAVIAALICHFELDFSDIEQRFSITFRDYFENELAALVEMENDGLLVMGNTSIKINDAGRLLIRRICMAFDAYIKKSKTSEEKGPKYSRII